MTAKELNLKVEVKNIDLAEGQHLTEEYMKVFIMQMSKLKIFTINLDQSDAYHSHTERQRLHSVGKPCDNEIPVQSIRNRRSALPERPEKQSLS